MAGTVEFTIKAHGDVVRLALWIALDSGEARAQAAIDRINVTLDRLARRPLLGRQDMEMPGKPHVFSVRPWKILYRPLPDEAGVLILRIIDSRRDVAALLGKKS